MVPLSGPLLRGHPFLFRRMLPRPLLALFRFPLSFHTEVWERTLLFSIVSFLAAL